MIGWAYVGYSSTATYELQAYEPGNQLWFGGGAQIKSGRFAGFRPGQSSTSTLSHYRAVAKG